jgi:hypothetical protein
MARDFEILSMFTSLMVKDSKTDQSGYKLINEQRLFNNLNESILTQSPGDRFWIVVTPVLLQFQKHRALHIFGSNISISSLNLIMTQASSNTPLPNAKF